MTEIVPASGAGSPAALVQWAQSAAAAHELAESLVRTQVCPEPFRGKAGEATAVMMLGAELDLSPIMALRSMYVIRGQVGMYVRAQLALVQARGHRVWTEKETDDSVTVAGHRAGDPEHVERVTWTIARARQAGFIRRGRNGEPSQYELQPRAMLWARAVGDVCRRIAADVLAGIPETDEPVPDASTDGRPSGSRVVMRRSEPDAQQPGPETAAPPQDGQTPGDPAWPDAARPALAGTVLAQDHGRQDAEPPGRVVPDEPPNDEPEPQPEPEPDDDPEPYLTGAQRARIMASLSALGVRDRDARLAYLTQALGREVETTNDLRITEAVAVIEMLTAALGDQE